MPLKQLSRIKTPKALYAVVKTSAGLKILTRKDRILQRRQHKQTVYKIQHCEIERFVLFNIKS